MGPYGWTNSNKYSRPGQRPPPGSILTDKIGSHQSETYRKLYGLPVFLGESNQKPDAFFGAAFYGFRNHPQVLRRGCLAIFQPSLSSPEPIGSISPGFVVVFRKDPDFFR